MQTRFSTLEMRLLVRGGQVSSLVWGSGLREAVCALGPGGSLPHVFSMAVPEASCFILLV